jgi:hypothetical protein
LCWAGILARIRGEGKLYLRRLPARASQNAGPILLRAVGNPGGGEMKKFLCMLVAVSFLLVPGASVCSARSKNVEMLHLKLQQKEESRALKLREHYMKQAWKNGHVSKAVREQQKHELQREKRKLRNRQKDERQELKDRLRIVRGH